MVASLQPSCVQGACIAFLISLTLLRSVRCLELGSRRSLKLVHFKGVVMPLQKQLDKGLLGV